MDYKITTLNAQLECKEQLISAFPELQFGDITEELMVFDSSAYYEERGIEEIDYRTFQRVNKRYIEGLIKYSEIDRSELFYQNKDGHILINKELTFLFLSFAEPALATYFNGLLGEIMLNGFACSDSYIMSLVSQRIPSNILQRIIDERNNVPQD